MTVKGKIITQNVGDYIAIEYGRYYGLHKGKTTMLFDSSGKILPKPEFNYNFRFSFSEGLDHQYISKGTDTAIKYMHSYSNDPMFEPLKMRNHFPGYVKTHLANKTGLLRAPDGFELGPPIFDNIERLAPDIISMKQNGLWGLIDTLGNKIIAPKYDSILPFLSDYAVVKGKNGYGLIDK